MSDLLKGWKIFVFATVWILGIAWGLRSYSRGPAPELQAEADSLSRMVGAPVRISIADPTAAGSPLIGRLEYSTGLSIQRVELTWKDGRWER
jgi:hypothetical protein